MKTIFTLLLTTFSMIIFAQNGLRIGDKVPSFEATADNGKKWKLNDNLGEQYLVVYFYPGAMTGGCTTQACSYRDLSSALKSQNASVVGISGDEPESLEFFKKSHNLNFTLLSDESGEIARIFGVPTREGTTFKGNFQGNDFELKRDITISRRTYIIDKNGKLVYKNEEVNASKDSQEVIDFLKNNS